MVEVFKTNVVDRNAAISIIAELQRLHITAIINFDLDDCDKILRIDTPTEITQSVIELMQNKGFNCEELTD
jgi:hypothetical protein